MKDKEIRKIHYLLILIPIFLIALGQTLAKIGSQFISIENFNIFDYLNIFTILAVMCLLLRSIIMLILYRKFDISFVYPIISVSYIIILIISVIFFSDSLTVGKILGSILISFGIYFIGSAKINNNYNNKNQINKKNRKKDQND